MTASNFDNGYGTSSDVDDSPVLDGWSMEAMKLFLSNVQGK